MAVTAGMVKELRAQTGAGMMDCKKALVASEGDIEAASDWLKNKGLSSAGKKSDRIAAEGAVVLKVADNFSKATMVEVNAETDFVSKNDQFKAFAATVAEQVHTTSPADIDALNATELNGDSFENFVKSNISTIGENIVVRRFDSVIASGNDVVNGYIHMGGQIGVLVEASCEKAEMKADVADFLKQLSMHIAAMKPSILSYTEFDADFVAKETEGMIKTIEKNNVERSRLKKPLKNVPSYVSKLQLTDAVMADIEAKLKDELKAEGKPEKIWDRILPGKIERFIADNTLLDQELCLLNQFYALDDKKTVSTIIEEKSKAFGGKMEITKFVRFELGDGIEKKEDDFAAEVEAQLK